MEHEHGHDCIPKTIPATPGTEDDGGWGELDHLIFEDAGCPAYWWVRYYHFIAHYAGEHQVVELCRLMAAVHINTGDHPNLIWQSWLWAQTKQRETKLTR